MEKLEACVPISLGTMCVRERDYLGAGKLAKE